MSNSLTVKCLGLGPGTRRCLHSCVSGKSIAHGFQNGPSKLLTAPEGSWKAASSMPRALAIFTSADLPNKTVSDQLLLSKAQTRQLYSQLRPTHLTPIAF